MGNLEPWGYLNGLEGDPVKWRLNTRTHAHARQGGGVAREKRGKNSGDLAPTSSLHQPLVKIKAFQKLSHLLAINQYLKHLKAKECRVINWIK